MCCTLLPNVFGAVQLGGNISSSYGFQHTLTPGGYWCGIRQATGLSKWVNDFYISFFNLRLAIKLRTGEWMYEWKNLGANIAQQKKGTRTKAALSMPVDSFDYHSPCPVPFASQLWPEMGLSACLSFEVLWLPAKRSVVPAAICEEAASSHPSLHFPPWPWGVGASIVVMELGGGT